MLESKLSKEQQAVIDSTNKRICIIAGAGSGKAVEENTPMIRSNGMIDIAKNIEKNDVIFDDRGLPTVVLNKYKVEPNNVYKITFSDGNSVICGGEHLWKFQTSDMRSKKNPVWTVDNTDNLYKIPLKKSSVRKGITYSRTNIYIPMSKPLFFEEHEVPIDPWLLGVLLGSGCLVDTKNPILLSSSEEDIIDRVKKIIESYKGIVVQRKIGKSTDFNIKCDYLEKILDELNLLGTYSNSKFIPDIYKYNSERIRYAVLQGLFDTNGIINHSNEYWTISESLSKDVTFLAESLGMTVKLSVIDKPTYTYKGEKKIGQKGYRLYIKCNEMYPQCYSSEKHLSKYKKPQSWAKRSIVSIDKLENYKGDFYCFEVDSPTHLFLLDHCIPTHNTTTLISKLLNYIDRGIKPHRIMVCCFTNKATAEIKARLFKKLNEKEIIYNEDSMWVGTIHGMCLKIIREYISYLPGYTKYFSIADDVKKERIANELIDILCINGFKAGNLINWVSYTKNANEFPENTKYFKEFKWFRQFYEKYNYQLKVSNSMDFDDILLNARILLQHPTVRKSIQKDFDVIMVDEFQDVNWVQYDIFKSLVDDNDCDYVVVGDDDQSIYAFRGSNIGYILNFDNDFSNSELHFLSRNYRCPRNIVKLGELIVKESLNRKEKILTSEITESEIIPYDLYAKDFIEAMNIVGRVQVLVKERNVNPNDIAVLYRTQRQSRSLEEYFITNLIPYQVLGGFSFYNRQEIKDVLAILHLMVGDYHEDYILRVINVPPRGIGPKTIRDLKNVKLPLWEVLEKCSHLKLSDKVKIGLLTFVKIIKQYSVKDTRDYKDIRSNLNHILEKFDYFNQVYKKDDPETAENRVGNVSELMDAMEVFMSKVKGRTIFDFFDYIITFMNSKEEKDGVKLMTLHGSKGLEFDHVFIAGVQKDVIPHKNCEDIDEERRLFYVGITRAKKQLYLSSNSDEDVYESVPCPFLEDKECQKELHIMDHRPDYFDTYKARCYYGNVTKENTKDEEFF